MDLKSILYNQLQPENPDREAAQEVKQLIILLVVTYKYVDEQFNLFKIFIELVLDAGNARTTFESSHRKNCTKAIQPTERKGNSC
jgi:hypothetical protein